MSIISSRISINKYYKINIVSSILNLTRCYWYIYHN